MLGDLPVTSDNRVLVDYRTSDDAGVYRLDERRALVQTVDFFTPVVDDPVAYGRIAGANALSDIYAMGGRPLTALAQLDARIGSAAYPELPVPGDWDGTGGDGIGVFRAATGEWFLDNWMDGTTDYHPSYGTNGDFPLTRGELRRQEQRHVGAGNP